jgi:hypothetical protein
MLAGRHVMEMRLLTGSFGKQNSSWLSSGAFGGCMMPLAVLIVNEFLVTNRLQSASIAGDFAVVFLLTWRIAKHRLAGVVSSGSSIKL